MSAQGLPALLQRFFTQRLLAQVGASPHTVACYRDAFRLLLRFVAKHVAAAAAGCPSLTEKHVTPHVLRHTTAMQMLRHGVDRSVIALWLGHESMETTQIYLHADMRLKEQALARISPAGVAPAPYRPDDTLLAFLESL